jgi:hypothetical protein
MATQREPVADGVAPHSIENVIPGSTLVEDACETICALFLVASIVLIAAEAIARNVFATSFQITDEVCGYLLVALTFLSMSVAEAHGAFHRVELVQTRLSFAARLIANGVRFHLAGGFRAGHLAVVPACRQFVARRRRRADAAADAVVAAAKRDGDRDAAAVLCADTDHGDQGEEFAQG